MAAADWELTKRAIIDLYPLALTGIFRNSGKTEVVRKTDPCQYILHREVRLDYLHRHLARGLSKFVGELPRCVQNPEVITAKSCPSSVSDQASLYALPIRKIVTRSSLSIQQSVCQL